MSYSLNSAGTYNTPIRCRQSDVAQCDYKEIAMKSTYGGPSYCFGDFAEKKHRWYRVCEKRPTPLGTMSLEDKVKCCSGQYNSYANCPVGSDGKPLLVPNTPICDAVVKEWCMTTHGGNPEKLLQLDKEIKDLENNILLNPNNSTTIDSRLITLDTKREERKKYLPKGGSDDPLCGCALPQSYYAASTLFGPVECIDKRCTNPEAYKLSTQIGTTCAITNCVTGNLNLTANDFAVIDNVKIDQDCGTDYTKNLINGTGSSPNNPVADEGVNPISYVTSSSYASSIYVSVFLIILLVTSLGVLFFKLVKSNLLAAKPVKAKLLPPRGVPS